MKKLSAVILILIIAAIILTAAGCGSSQIDTPEKLAAHLITMGRAERFSFEISAEEFDFTISSSGAYILAEGIPPVIVEGITVLSGTRYFTFFDEELYILTQFGPQWVREPINIYPEYHFIFEMMLGGATLGDFLNFLFLLNLNNFEFDLTTGQFVYASPVLDLLFLNLPFDAEFNYIALAVKGDNTLSVIFDGDTRVTVDIIANAMFAALPNSIHIDTIIPPPAFSVQQAAAHFYAAGWNYEIVTAENTGAALVFVWYGDYEPEFNGMLPNFEEFEDALMFATFESAAIMNLALDFLMLEDLAAAMELELHIQGRMLWLGSENALEIFEQLL